MQLLNEDAVSAVEAPEPSAAGADPVAIADPVVGPSLRRFLILSQFPEAFTRIGWTPEEVFWSRVYWFRRFVRLRIGTTGPDAGLEQQAIQILEHPRPECSPDWSDLEWVEALAERDADDQIRPRRENTGGSHPIAEAAVGRLARLAGVADPAEWARHIEAEARIPDLVAGDVGRAWEACLPTWLEQGRVRDLSRSLRVPRYWPSFAKTLGDAFAEQHWQDYSFLLELLERHPFDSAEYLCACDLLEVVVHEFASRDLEVPAAVFGAGGPLPWVIRRELPLDRRQLCNVGESLARLYAEDYARDDGPDPDDPSWAEA
jgi:hypothetical protein